MTRESTFRIFAHDNNYYNNIQNYRSKFKSKDLKVKIVLVSRLQIYDFVNGR